MPTLPDANFRCQAAFDWRKWTKGGCSFPFVCAVFKFITELWQCGHCDLDDRPSHPAGGAMVLIDLAALRDSASPSCPAWRSYDLPTQVQDALTSDGFQSLTSPATLDYDTAAYPFREDLLVALLRKTDTTNSAADQPIQRVEKKKRDQAVVNAFQDRLAALPLEKLHIAVDPASTPDDDLHIPRYFSSTSFVFDEGFSRLHLK